MDVLQEAVEMMMPQEMAVETMMPQEMEMMMPQEAAVVVKPPTVVVVVDTILLTPTLICPIVAHILTIGCGISIFPVRIAQVMMIASVLPLQ